MPPLPDADLDHVLAHASDLFEPLRGRRLFVTGGTGFFGAWMLESFLRANRLLDLRAEAWVLTRSPAAFRAKAPHLALSGSVHLLEGDVRSVVFPDGEFAAVIHAATESSTNLNAERPGEMLDVIIQGTRRMLDLARHGRARRFLLVSSGAVYGSQPPSISHLREDHPGGPDPTAPSSAYAEGKRVAELLAVLAAGEEDLGATIARCFAFVGPHLPLHAHFAAGNFIRDGLSGGPIMVQGDGTPRRSYLHAADLAIWLWTILFRGAPGRAYNVGSEDDRSIAEIATLVAESFAPAREVRIARAPVPGAAAARYVPSVGRAREELSLAVRIDLSDAIARTVRWHRAQGVTG